MAEYRIHALDDTGRIVFSLDFEADHDERAVQWIKRLVDKKTLELWRGEKCLGRFEPE